MRSLHSTHRCCLFGLRDGEAKAVRWLVEGGEGAEVERIGVPERGKGHPFNAPSMTYPEVSRIFRSNGLDHH